MKILFVGVSGIFGQVVVVILGVYYELICVGWYGGDVQVDFIDDVSVQVMFDQVGMLDVVVVMIGCLYFGLLVDMCVDQFNLGLQDKLFGQVWLVLVVQCYLWVGGLIMLISGIVSVQLICDGVNVIVVNVVLEGFVCGVVCELLLCGLCINVVSLNVLVELMDNYGVYFFGFELVIVQCVLLVYQCSVEGVQSGQVFIVW